MRIFILILFFHTAALAEVNSFDQKSIEETFKKYYSADLSVLSEKMKKAMGSEKTFRNLMKDAKPAKKYSIEQGDMNKDIYFVKLDGKDNIFIVKKENGKYLIDSTMEDTN